MNSWKEDFLNQFESRLAELLRGGFEDPSLQEVITYQFFPAGKRIRPLITAALSLDLNLPAGSFLDFCCATEILHTASLIHDDLPELDNDLSRRGRPTLHAAYGAAKALLVGDYLISRALSVCCSAETLDSARTLSAARITNLLAESFCKVCHGQVIDVANCGSELEEILSFYDLKTGALFAASIEIPRILAIEDLKLPQDTIKPEFTKLAKTVGRAFQLINDFSEIEPAENKEQVLQRQTDQNNQRKTVNTILSLSEARDLVSSLIAEIWDNVEIIESKLAEYGAQNLSRTREILKSIF